jgi:hypothetical protein
MPSNLTLEDKQAVVEHLKQEYFLIRSQVVWLVVGLLVAAGIGTGYAAYTAAKAAASTEAEKIAKAEAEKVAKSVVADTPAKIATDEIISLKKKADEETGEITKLKGSFERELKQIRLKQMEAGNIVTGLAPEIKALDAKITGLTVRFGTPTIWKHGPSYANAIVHPAPSSGVVVLTNSGSGVGSAEGGI